jgi:hypothetical protein
VADEVKVPQEVTQRYREMGAEEPPRALDDAILAAARRSARPWAQRWAVPLSLAAVLVLSVTVTLRIQHEQPGIESPAQAVKEAAREAPGDVAMVAPPRESLQLKAEKQFKPATRKEPQPFQAAQDRATAAAPAPSAIPVPAAAPAPAEMPALRADQARSAESSIAGARARQSEERVSRDAEAAARAPQVGPVQALAKRAEAPAARAMVQSPETPERELERIAQLRRDAKHEEADKALAEFRKRYPDYTIPPPVLGRVERR